MIKNFRQLLLRIELLCVLRRSLQVSRFRTAMCLDPDGSAEIYTEQKGGCSVQRLRTNAQWQLLDDKTLYLRGSQAVTCKIIKINNWSVTVATPAALVIRLAGSNILRSTPRPVFYS